jgi:hypothetical protein
MVAAAPHDERSTIADVLTERAADARRMNTRVVVADDEEPVAELLRRILMTSWSG